MTLAAPWVLLALTALPLLWWLLRVTPPAPRRQSFPAIRLLVGLKPKEETPARTPPWLLALRMLAAALVIVGLAGPVRDSGGLLAGSGPVLLVIDNGWASAADWPARMRAAGVALDRAARAGRPAALLATADNGSGNPPTASPVMAAVDLRDRLASLHPEPWPTDRAGAAAALRGFGRRDAAVVYIANGLRDGAGFDGFAGALRGAGAVTEVCCGPPARMMLSPISQPDRLIARIAQVPRPAASQAVVLAQTGDGRSLARVEVTVPAGAASARAPIGGPPELRNQITRLVLEGTPSAGSVALLDEGQRTHPVGLAVNGDPAQSETPFLGSLYYVRRALAPYAELHIGDVSKLLAGNIAMLVLPDALPEDQATRAALAKWVEAGGLLVRFAGPGMADATHDEPDPLLPVRLIKGDRDLGGTMSWSKPAGLAPFPADSPFAGLAVPADVAIRKQVLADPSPSLAAHTWARLADGTPLVTEAARGRGRVVLFHVTADADWSNLPLSGLFVDMLRRLVRVSAGIAEPPAGNAMLAPRQTLNGFGVLGPPPIAAVPLAAEGFATTEVSPRHPPGFYGRESAGRALNLGTAMPALQAAPMVAGSRVEKLLGTAPVRAFGPWLIAAAVLLLGIDMVIALLLRGLLRPPRRRAVAAAILLGMLVAGGTTVRVRE